jgi:aminoglycoside phosphotransferase (APT) family kinase protein
MQKLHDNEISIDTPLVQKLIDKQFPQYAQLPLTRLTASGSTNILYRLGDNLLVRLPRQPGSGAAILKEQQWLPVIGHQLPVEVPEYIAIGKPDLDYAECWSLTQWIEGDLASAWHPVDPPGQSQTELAIGFADLVRALREIDVPEAAFSDSRLRPYRGKPLADHDKYFRHSVVQCRKIKDLELDLDAAVAIWEEAITLPGASETTTDHWFHGDLVAENLLMNNNQITAVLDFGGLGIGDPTVDLHGAWELLGPEARDLFRQRIGVDDSEWLRARAWALAIPMMTFAYYWHTMPDRIHDRLIMARSVLSEVERN